MPAPNAQKTADEALGVKTKGDAFVPPPAPVPGPRPKQEEVVEQPEVDEAQDESPRAKETGGLLKAIQGLNEQVQSTKTNASLLTDPDILKLLELKQRGVRPVIEEPKAQAQPVAESVVDDLPADADTMTNAQLMGWFLKQQGKLTKGMVDGAVASAVSGLKKELEPRLAAAAQLAQDNARDRTERDIADMAKKHEDFEALRPTMAKIAQATTGLSLEDVYNLAKLRAGTPAVPAAELETERPSPVPSARRARSPVGVGRLGKSGFADLISRRFDSLGEE